jgi:hypothetical protein
MNITSWNDKLAIEMKKYPNGEDVGFLSECFEHKVARNKFKKAFNEIFGGENEFYIIYRYNGNVEQIVGFDDEISFIEACANLCLSV